ncbi:MAG: ABC transporter permease [Candidatus Heimdallarchaeota archaeon]|nr:ABC transporter permease [Candidatus Heimdallarchaeota archaeon]
MRLATYISIRFITIFIQTLGISMILFSVYGATGYDVGVAHFGLAAPQFIEWENEQLGTNYSIAEQYVNFWEGLFVGQCTELNSTLFTSACERGFGLGWEGPTYKQDITETVIDKFINSMVVFLISFLIYGSVGVVFGVIASVKSGKTDQIIHFVTSAMIGIPSILLIIFIFRIFLNLDDPNFNILEIRRLNVSQGMEFMQLKYLFLPILTHAFISISFVFRYTREIVVDEMQAPYLRTAKAKGLNPRQVVGRHLLPNIYGQLINVLAISVPLGISSMAFIEFIYGYDGLFNYMLTAVVDYYDFPVLHAGTILISLVSSLLMNVANIFSTILTKVPENKIM